MASPSPVLDQPFHVRSISLPSGPQPLALRFDEELQKLRTCAASTSSETQQMMFNGLRELGNLYDCIEEVLRLPSNQQSLSRTNQKKWVERELDQSIKLLDLCTVMRNNLVAMKEHAQDLGLALRRKDAVPESNLKAYTRLRKKAQKEIKSCFRYISTLEMDCDVSMEIRMLMEARDITVSLLQAVFSSLSKSKEAKDRRWSFVSKALRWRKAACEDEREYANKAETLEQFARRLDYLFRRLILNRVSLLNIFSL